jgi:hypothetical protein
MLTLGFSFILPHFTFLELCLLPTRSAGLLMLLLPVLLELASLTELWSDQTGIGEDGFQLSPPTVVWKMLR